MLRVQELQEAKRLKSELERNALEQKEEAEKLSARYLQLKRTKSTKSLSSVSTALDIPIEVPKINRKDISAQHDGGYTEIGSGTFGNCYLGRYRGFVVAVKSMKHPRVSKSDVEAEGCLIYLEFVLKSSHT